MKVAFLTDAISRNAGGVFDAVRRLAQSVAQPGQDVRVFGVSDSHSTEDALDWQPVSVNVSPCVGPRSFGYAPTLNHSIDAFDPDVVHPQGLWKYSSIASRTWHRRTGRPYIIHSHGMLDPWAVQNSKWKKRVAALLYENAHLRGAACIRALCESEAQSIRAFGLRNPICVIPNGIDLPLLESREQRAEIRNQPGPPTSDLYPLTSDGRKTLLYLGRLHPKKNLGPLLDAWATMQRDHPAAKEWVLAIAGWDQGGYEAKLRALTSDLCLLKSVLFLGPKFGEEKTACYAQCDAFVLPSLSEGLPMVVLEAWAFAKPVLMTTECNLPEGFQAKAALRIGTDADAITSGLRELMEMSGAERAAMGERGRTLVSERFLWSQIGDEMRRVCEWAVNGGPVPSSVRLD